MVKNKLAIAFGAVIVLLISVIFLMDSTFSKAAAAYKSKNSELEKSYETLGTNYKTLKESYETTNKNYNELKEHSEELEQESASLSTSLEKTQEEVDETLEKLEDFDVTVKESMSWFSENSNIEGLGTYDPLAKILTGNCIKKEPGSCKINAKCIYDQNLGRFRYLSDESVTSSSDLLKNLTTMLKQKGGDCEDFSLLFAAEYNYLVDSCINSSYDRNQIIVYTGDNTGDDEIIDGNYMYPVCGYFKPEGSEGIAGGHCVVAVTNSPVTGASDVYEKLKSATLVEPQTGEPLFKMDKPNAKTTIFNDGTAPDTLYYLSIVIIEDDLKVFYTWSEEVKWIGYSEFLEEIQQLKGKLK